MPFRAPKIDVGNAMLRALQIKGAINKNALIEMKLKNQGKEKLKLESDLLDYAVKSARFISHDEYPQYRQNMIRLGMSSELLPDQEFNSPEEWQAFIEPRIYTAQDMIAIKNARLNNQKLKMSKRLKDGTVRTVEAKNEEEFDQFQAQGYERGGLAGTPIRAKFGEAKKGVVDGKQVFFRIGEDPNDVQILAGVAPEPSKGMKIFDPVTGNLMVDTTGGAGSTGLTKPTLKKVEGELLKATTGLSRLNQIRNMFKPEYQELGTRWGAMWTSAKEKLGFKPSGEDRAGLAEFSSFKRRAISNINLYIKEITGAQMSEAEASRLTKGMPDPGKGLIDGDSPTAFESKMNDVISELRMAAARYHYVTKNGLTITDVPLDKMPAVINERGRQILEALRTNNPGMDIDTMKQQARDMLAEEFGLIE